MPELPDVEVFRRYLESTALHKPIERTSVKDPDVLGDVTARKLQTRLKGRAFVGTRRHGKYLFVHTDRVDWLVLHFGMTGFLKYHKEASDTPPHTRAVFDLRNGYHLSYVCQRKLGLLDHTEDVGRFLYAKDLGPDALSLDLRGFRGLLADRRGRVKPTLMNQGVLAGIGNIYSDEILFDAAIHPEAPIPKLDDRQVEGLFRSVRKVLLRAIDWQVDVDRFPNSYLLPHREENGGCPRCGVPLARIKVSGRTSIFCPAHQEKSGE